ncbi:peptidoglycan-binding protein [Streptomyces sp. NPDC020742]|uniref:peptidoglycan-binding protein n=1 Tax=Streptomyces sp. NPDC020742 TaxID=3154897 RepID=UPI0034027AE1
MRGLQAERVAEIIVVRHDGTGRRGSGYLVRADTVLTAAHVVAGAQQIRVRSEKDGSVLWDGEAEVAWSDGNIDVAILALSTTPKALGRIRPAVFGAVREGDAGLRCSALGFPLFKRRQDARGVYRDSFHARGGIALLTGRREGVLELRVQEPERDPDPWRSPWEGMSGAAVWAHGRIIGLITAHHRPEGLGSLTIRRADRWADQVEDEASLAALDRAGLRPPLPFVAPVWRNRKVLIGSSVVCVTAAATAWWMGRPDPLHLEIVGTCTRADQRLINRSSGFTPGGGYTDEVIAPDGSTLQNVFTTGTVNSDGSLKLAWPCSSTDLRGTYRVRVTDQATGRRTGWSTFDVRYVPPYRCRFRQHDGLWYAGNSDTQDALLAPGSHGREVAEAQCLLQRLGYELGTAGVDGRYGANTDRAIVSLQTKGGLPPDGKLGAKTWHALRTVVPPTKR